MTSFPSASSETSISKMAKPRSGVEITTADHQNPRADRRRHQVGRGRTRRDSRTSKSAWKFPSHRISPAPTGGANGGTPTNSAAMQQVKYAIAVRQRQGRRRQVHRHREPSLRATNACSQQTARLASASWTATSTAHPYHSDARRLQDAQRSRNDLNRAAWRISACAPCRWASS